MRERGIAETRENYIRLNWGHPISEEDWTPEHEDQLPPHLREE